MALSGSFYTNVNEHWRLSISWSATQDIAKNQSTITAKMYWQALDGYGAVNSSATKTSAIQHDDGAFSTESSAGMAGLSGNQKKLINTYTFTLTHDSDGTKSFSLDGYFDAEVNLSGIQYNRINLVQTTFTLNTIPRASTLSSSESWTAGSNGTIEVKRYSSSFRHEVEIYIKNAAGVWDWIKKVDLSTSEVTKSTSFTVEENRQIFVAVGGRTSAETRMLLQTFKGDDLIGSKDYFGTLSIPAASSTTWGGDFNIGETMAGKITQYNSYFTHTIQMIFSGTTYTLENQTADTDWSYDTSAIASALYAKTPNAKSITGELRIFTYYQGELVRSYKATNVTAYVTDSEPDFGTGYTYEDTNDQTIALTSNPQYVIQNKSKVLVEIPVSAKADPKNSATMKEYVITLNGVTKTMAYSDTAVVSYNFGAITAGTNATLTIKAVDSRGFYTTTSKTVIVIPYTSPVVATSAARLNSFETETILKLSGSFSLLNVSGVNKNDIVAMQYRYKESTTSVWGGWANFSYDKNKENYVAIDVHLTLDNTKAFNIEVKTTDKLGTTTVAIAVSVGKPIFFIDPIKKSMGFNDIPISDNEFRINGRIVFGSNMWAGTGQGEGLLFPKNGTEAGSPVDTDYYNLYVDGDGWVCINDIRIFHTTPNDGSGFDLGNGNIWGANSIYFNDTATGAEALNFIKSGKPTNSLINADYDSLRVLDGTGFLNDIPIFTSDNEVLWNGAYSMTESHEVTPSKPIKECPNGWVLVWSDYTSGAAGNYHWVYTVVHKSHVDYASGAGCFFSTPNLDNSYATKYIYVNPTSLVGHTVNDSTVEQQNVVLRKVLSW